MRSAPNALFLGKKCNPQVFLIVVICVVMGCATLEYESAAGICPLSACSDWKFQRFEYKGIPISGFYKPGRRRNHLTVYIEGDGNAWRSRSRVSSDPTPDDPIALRLALRDPNLGILYLARPCQYVGRKRVVGCDPSLWTAARYSAEVIEAMNRAITASKLSPDERLTLVGFSGGGVIATLVASRRQDLDELVTVAAPLDSAAWTSHHQVSHLKDSLNPSESLPTYGTTREFHFHGGRDLVVPPEVIERYRKLSSRANVRFFIIPEFKHQCCWVRDWPKLMTMVRKRTVHSVPRVRLYKEEVSRSSER